MSRILFLQLSYVFYGVLCVYFSSCLLQLFVDCCSFLQLFCSHFQLLRTVKNEFVKFWTQIFNSRPENPILGLICCVEFKFAVNNSGFKRSGAKQNRKNGVEKKSCSSLLFLFLYPFMALICSFLFFFVFFVFPSFSRATLRCGVRFAGCFRRMGLQSPSKTRRRSQRRQFQLHSPASGLSGPHTPVIYSQGTD